MEPETWLEQDEESVHVYLRRRKEARRAGLTIVEAQMFAESDVDIGVLRKLVRDGCDPDLIREIVL